MKKLLVQGDDFGFTKGVTYGIVDAIDNGILRNTGLFANMPSATLAVSFMKDRPHVCFGIDFNIDVEADNDFFVGIFNFNSYKRTV